MAYSGTPLDNPGSSRILDNGSHHSNDVLQNTADLDVGITVVSGLTPSGHALLRIRYSGSSGLKSSYFHVDEVGSSVPKFIDGKHNFERYITDNDKSVKGTVWFGRDAANIQNLINELNLYKGGKTYFWGGGFHNCWSFAIAVAKKAGYSTPSFGATCFKSPIALLEKLKADNQNCRLSRNNT